MSQYANLTQAMVRVMARGSHVHVLIGSYRSYVFLRLQIFWHLPQLFIRCDRTSKMEESANFIPLGAVKGRLPFDKPEKPARPPKIYGATKGDSTSFVREVSYNY
jgi:hypothetical protein